ncbi:hypothetical protein BH24ACT12_BH24ACT12_07130 [soil metagenome]|jgi:hypothetical protein
MPQSNLSHEPSAEPAESLQNILEDQRLEPHRSGWRRTRRM